MKLRKHLAGVATASLAVSVLALSAPAGAATTTHDADDPSFDSTVTTQAVAGDLIGVGSDTSQHALHLIGEAWNTQVPAPAFRVASFAATSAGSIGLPTADVTRPNGSGAGKTTLYNPSNPDIDFARSSSSLNTNETNAGLRQFPFALDTLKMAVSNSTPSHAPASLTGAQIVAIYKCDPTADDWSELGGTAGTIAPKIPQAGSGTRNFFVAQLQALNGNVAVTLGGCVLEVQEHDDTFVKNNADAIAPFSEGRAGLLGSTLRLLNGWSADRALYNVVRGTDLANSAVQAAFGEDGFVCSNAARSLIEAAGFKQLATAAHGGVCGQATTTATSNFTLNQQVSTTTTLAATSPSAGAAHLDAHVTATTSPSGSVEFFEGVTSKGIQPLVSGHAILNLSGQTPGSHTYTAKFTGDAPTQDPSQDDATVTVKAASTTTIAFSPTTSSYGHSRTIKVTVLSGGLPADGSVSIKVGTATPVIRLTNISGIASLVVPASKAAGTYSIVGRFLGNAVAASSMATKSLVIAKATPTITESFPSATTVGGRGKGVVKVAIAGSTLKPTGKVSIKLGTKTIVLAKSLVNGQVTITLPRLSKGTKTLTIVYSGSSNVKSLKKSFTITQR